MYAIVDIAGQQFKVEAGKEIFLNHTASTFVNLLIFIQSYFTLLCRHIPIPIIYKVVWAIAEGRAVARQVDE